MRKRNSRKICVLLSIILVLPNIGFSQYIRDHLDIDLACNYSLPTGRSVISKEVNNIFSYQEPLFFSNYSGARSVSLAIIYKPETFFNLGIKLNGSSDYSKWNSTLNKRYAETNLSITSCSFPFGLKIPIEKIQLFRNFRLINYYAPGLNHIEFQNSTESYGISDLEGIQNVELPVELILEDVVRSEQYNSAGFELSVYLEYLLFYRYSFFFEYSYKIVKTNSMLYPDNYFRMNNFHWGISIKLMKDKRYYY